MHMCTDLSINGSMMVVFLLNTHDYTGFNFHLCRFSSLFVLSEISKREHNDDKAEERKKRTN